jgi:hypothetical protein
MNPGRFLLVIRNLSHLTAGFAIGGIRRRLLADQRLALVFIEVDQDVQTPMPQ